MDNNDRWALRPTSKPLLFSLSNEILLLIIHNVPRRDGLAELRLTCKRLNKLSEAHFFRHVEVILDEQDEQKWTDKLIHVPAQITYIEHLTILNDCTPVFDAVYPNPVTSTGSNRVRRWVRMREHAREGSIQFMQSAFLSGARFCPDRRLEKNQLKSFRYRHAWPLRVEALTKLLKSQALSIAELEISMIESTDLKQICELDTLANSSLAGMRLKTLVCRGLSYTESWVNSELGGKLRVIRPLFRQTYQTLRELRLTQEHYVCLIGVTPASVAYSIDNTLCTIDELYYWKALKAYNKERKDLLLNLETLELGGFTVDNLVGPRQVHDNSSRFLKFNLPVLKKLFLHDCLGVDDLLKQMTQRSGEIALTHFGLRIHTPRDRLFTKTGDVADVLPSFLLSFRGLVVLSILSGRGNFFTGDRSVLTHHCQSLQVYVHEERVAFDIQGVDTRFCSLPVSTYNLQSGYFAAESRPRLKEIGLNITGSDLKKHGLEALMYLSQFDELETVHIRSFPPLQVLHIEESETVWRNERGHVVDDAITIAERFAEMIALRDGTRKTNPTIVQTSVEAPPKPKLGLLIVGDWRYRDQMFLSGPRSWNPWPWQSERFKEENPESRGVYFEEDLDAADEQLNPQLAFQKSPWCSFRDDFGYHWSPAIFPIFFKIEWVLEEKGGAWYYEALADVLEQTTLNGHPELNHVESLEFAWQD